MNTLHSSESKNLISSAKHWETLADEAERMDAWDRKVGIGPPADLPSANTHKAKIYRDVAHAQRLEAATGVVHCSCHHQPLSQCAHQPQSRR